MTTDFKPAAKRSGTDLEAYVRHCTMGEVSALLTKQLGPIDGPVTIVAGRTRYLAGEAVMLMQQDAPAGYLCVWLRGSDRWADSASFGRHLARHLHRVVRCDPGDAYPRVSVFSDVFLEVSDDGESLIEWS